MADYIGAIRLTARALTQPLETFDYFAGLIANLREAGDGEYAADAQWLERAHTYFHCTWPCDNAHEFDHVWKALSEELEATGIAAGAAGSLDADSRLAQAVWCAVRHLRPDVVVETGVARGITSRIVLEALRLNGRGKLWSIDLPPFAAHWGAGGIPAVPSEIREGWNYIRGASRRKLRPLLEVISSIDLFIHDSLHTRKNVSFELETVWPRLSSHAVVIVDDADASPAFDEFRRKHDVDGWGTMSPRQLSRGMIGVFFKGNLSSLSATTTSTRSSSRTL